MEFVIMSMIVDNANFLLRMDEPSKIEPKQEIVVKCNDVKLNKSIDTSYFVVQKKPLCDNSPPLKTTKQ